MGLVYCALAGCASFKFLDGFALVACHGGILSSLNDGIVCRHHRSPALAMKPAGQDPGSATALGTMHSTALLGEELHSELRTVPLCSARNASPFSIILLLVFRRADHGMIMPSDRACRPSCRAPSLPKLRRLGTPKEQLTFNQ